MRRRIALLALTALACFSPAFGQIADILKAAVKDGKVPGAVVLVARHGKVELLEAAGYADVEKRKPMRKDSIVQIMSQTKSITTVAAMMLVDEGKLDLKRPVEDYLPEFKGQMVEEKRANGSVYRHAPAHPPTVAELMSHSAGFPFLPAHELSRLNFTLDVTLKEAMPVYGRTPLVHEPGTRHLYSNMGIATVGRLIEVLSGLEYTQFVRQRLLVPLGMTDSFYFPPDDKKSRIAMLYRDENGGMVLAGENAQGGDSAKYRKGARYSGPELAMFSTAGDLMRFYQMMANGGIYGGRRYLSAESVKLMTTDRTPDHQGYGYGFTTWNNSKVKDYGFPAGTFGHGGAFATAGWVDPKHDMVIVFLTQVIGNSAAPVRLAAIRAAEASAN